MAGGRGDASQRSAGHLKQLGQGNGTTGVARAAVLERVPNPHPRALYLARFTAPEFTSLCPVTGQPDFAHLVIDYAPRRLAGRVQVAEALSWARFRNHGAFHEDCTVAIGKRIVAAPRRSWLRIGGYWYPRGGIPIDVFWQTGPPPEGPVAARPGRRALSRPRLTP